MTKITREKIAHGDPEEIGCKYTVNDGGPDDGKSYFSATWRLFMPFPVPTDQGEFDAAKTAALDAVAWLQETAQCVINYLIHADNAKVGDSVSSPECVDPIGTMRATHDAVLDGSWNVRGGSGDMTQDMIRTLLAADANKAVAKGGLGLPITKARTRVKDDRAKLESEIAKARGVKVAEYRDRLPVRAAAALE